LQKEVDFLVTRNGRPWFLVEVKKSGQSLSPSLVAFREALKVSHAFQVVLDLPCVDVDCFNYNMPVVVPARTFLSQRM
jgi:hypothetical protein